MSNYLIKWSRYCQLYWQRSTCSVACTAAYQWEWAAAHSTEYSYRGGAYRRHIIQYVSKRVPSGSIVPFVLVVTATSNADQFSKFFHRCAWQKLCTEEIPTYLKRVATLPCEICRLLNASISQAKKYKFMKLGGSSLCTIRSVQRSMKEISTEKLIDLGLCTCTTL